MGKLHFGYPGFGKHIEVDPSDPFQLRQLLCMGGKPGSSGNSKVFCLVDGGSPNAYTKALKDIVYFDGNDEAYRSFWNEPFI